MTKLLKLAQRKKMTKYFCMAAAVLFFCGCAEKHSPMLEQYLSVLKEQGYSRALFQDCSLLWETKGEYNVVYSDDSQTSFKAVEHYYTGGAHGTTKTTVGTLRRGKILKLADLPNRSELEKRWKQAIVKHFKAKSFEEHVREKGKIFMPFMTENFYLDDRGIHFIYDPYEIDCYAAGTIDIFVPWKF